MRQSFSLVVDAVGGRLSTSSVRLAKSIQQAFIARPSIFCLSCGGLIDFVRRIKSKLSARHRRRRCPVLQGIDPWRPGTLGRKRPHFEAFDACSHSASGGRRPHSVIERGLKRRDRSVTGGHIAESSGGFNRYERVPSSILRYRADLMPMSSLREGGKIETNFQKLYRCGRYPGSIPDFFRLQQEFKESVSHTYDPSGAHAEVIEHAIDGSIKLLDACALRDLLARRSRSVCWKRHFPGFLASLDARLDQRFSTQLHLPRPPGPASHF